ncbi:MAG: T9SS type A sorting domain-containing protein [Bacteroidetes bacterium]|nr:T9SS type A sorting domain-containing protein [Bacteroidota bacterium]
MNNITLLILTLLFTQIKAISQPCLPEGITFNTQAQIDNFQTNHPNCTEIEGNVEINGNDITNLNGLNVLTSIGGDIEISGNYILTNLMGLENLTSIGGSFTIGVRGYSSQGNPALSSLIGLDNLTSIGGNLIIEGTSVLTSLTGLENLTSVQGDLIIGYYHSYMSLYCTGNSSLLSLTGLENLVYIGGSLEIYCNDALTSLTGLESLVSIEGDLKIGFYAWYFYGGAFHAGNPSLTSLSGLEGITSIGGDLNIMDNNALPDLSGLDNLSSIGGGLTIGTGFIEGGGGNQTLSSLMGLSNLTTIGGGLGIVGNPVLTSLSGLDNVNAESISGLFIANNVTLSTCEVESVCEYLANPGGEIEIHDNAPGCNSMIEVQTACDSITSVEELNFKEKFTISPNPLESGSIIEYTLHQNSPVTLKILDLSGRSFRTLVNEYQPKGEQRIECNTTALPAGIYFCTLKTNERIQTRKIIKL